MGVLQSGTRDHLKRREVVSLHIPQACYGLRHERLHRGHDLLSHLFDARRGYQRLREASQGGELLGPLDGRFVQPRILDGDGGLGGEDREKLLVLLREGLLARFAENAEDAHEAVVAEQGLGHDGSVTGAIHEMGDRVRGGAEVVDDHSLPALGHSPRHALAEPERHAVLAYVASREGPLD